MITIYKNFNIADKSYVHIGGKVAEYSESDDLLQTINYLSAQSKFICIGNTSKILFCFEKSPYTFFKFTNKKIVFFKECFFAYSGASLNYIQHILSQKNISGFEYLSTIPGCLGGSIVNNSSFLKQTISDLLISILVYEKGSINFIEKKDIDFSYRQSGLIKDNFLIIGAYFKIIKSDQRSIQKKIAEGKKFRLNHQGTYLNTLGSTFKNTAHYQVGRILDELSYKGFSLTKSCKVSPLHANFCLIEPYSNYQDIYNLINFLKEVLYNYLKEKIELEIQVILANGRENK